MDIEKPQLTQQEQKYDRQLRLWGAHGQLRLIKTKLCLLGTEAAGVETLKNLALPGMGEFTVIDNKAVTERDLGNNFFVTVDDIGKDKASVICQNILEMNNDIQGQALTKNISELINSNKATEFFKQFSIVLASQVNEKDLIKLSQICSENEINLVIVYTNGLIGYCRIFGNNHYTKETKPADIIINDLRLMQPFPELFKYAMEFELKELDMAEHQHIPYVVLLLQNLEQWKKNNNNELPKTFDQKTQFKKTIQSQSINFADETNYQEAVRYYFQCFQNPSELSEEIVGIFKQLESIEINKTSDSFWILTKALKQFYEQFKVLPLLGKIPDMTSYTHHYVKLVQIYQKKAEEDRAIMRNIITELLKEDSVPIIQEEELKNFCENCLTLNFILYRTYKQEVESIEIPDYFETNCYKWYFCIRATQRFYDQNGKYPTVGDEAKMSEILKTMMEQIKQNEANPINSIEQKYVSEICRYGGSEIHSIASFIGGVAAEEAIKLITKQFFPINNTFIYDGIQCVSEVYTF